MTQGRNAEEFIDMVNDVIGAVCATPEEYQACWLRSIHAYLPQHEKLQEHSNGKIDGSQMHFVKREEVLQKA